MLKKMNLSDQAYDELVKKIISGGYPGGTTLQEEKLASEFGISRTPVREALKRLAAEGLIEQLPRKGFRVAMPDDDALTELFECRCGLELLALKNAMGAIPPEKIETLKEKLRSAKGFPQDRPRSGRRDARPLLGSLRKSLSQRTDSAVPHKDSSLPQLPEPGTRSAGGAHHGAHGNSGCRARRRHGKSVHSAQETHSEREKPLTLCCFTVLPQSPRCSATRSA